LISLRLGRRQLRSDDILIVVVECRVDAGN